MSTLRPDERDLLRDAFIRLDSNGDGLLTFADVESAARAVLGDERVQMIMPMLHSTFVQADKDGDDRLSLVEFLSSFVEGIGVLPSDVLAECVGSVRVRLTDEQIYALQRNFSTIDRDQDGLISPEELTDTLRTVLAADGELTEAALVELSQLIMEVVDRDGDGRLNLSEFIRSFQEDQGLLPPVLAEARLATVKNKARRSITGDDERRDLAAQAIVSVWKDQCEGRPVPFAQAQSALMHALQPFYDEASLKTVVEGVLSASDRDGRGNVDLEGVAQSIASGLAAAADAANINHSSGSGGPHDTPTTQHAANASLQAFPPENVAHRVRKVFAVLDADDDGFLREDDIMPLMVSLSSSMNPQWPDATNAAVCDGVFCAADKDADGRLSREEFLDSFANGYGVLPNEFIIDMSDKLIAKPSDDDWETFGAIFSAIQDNFDAFVSKRDLHRALSAAIAEYFADDATTGRTIADIVTDQTDDGRGGCRRFPQFVQAYVLDKSMVWQPLLAAQHAALVAQRARVAAINRTRATEGPLIAAPHHGPHAAVARDAMIHRAFAQLDANHDGFLDRGELDPVLRVTIRSRRQDWTAQGVATSIDMMVAHADVDRDGMLSFSEFRATYEHGAPGIIHFGDLDAVLSARGDVHQLAQILRVPLDEPLQLAASSSNQAPSSAPLEEKSINSSSADDSHVRDLTYVFRLLDSDVNGFIDFKDVVEPASIWMRRTNPDWADDRIETTLHYIFSVCDEDHDGRLSLHEFVHGFQNGNLLFPEAAIREMTEQRRATRENPASWTQLTSQEIGLLRDAVGSCAPMEDGFIDPASIQHVIINAATEARIDLRQANATIDAILSTVRALDDGRVKLADFVGSFEILMAESPPSSPTAGSHRQLLRAADRALSEKLNGKQLRDLAHDILLLDVDKNGIVDLDAVGSAIRDALVKANPTILPAECDRVITAVSKTANVDEKFAGLSLEPFINFLINKYYVVPPDEESNKLERKLTAEEIDELRAIFRAIDENNDGAIQANEFELILREALEQSTTNVSAIPAIVASVMAAADENRDGKVSFREFVDAFEKDAAVLDIPIMAAAARMDMAQRKMEAMLAEHELRDLARAFLYLDKNGDGFLQPDELRGAMVVEFAAAHPEWSKQRVQSTVESLIQSADVNGDGRLSLDEFIKAFLEGHYVLPPRYIRDVVSQTARPLTEDEIAQVKSIFQLIDENHDGFITVEELRRTLTPAVGRATADAVCGAVMLIADENKDGKLTLQEFLRAYQIDNGILYVPINAVSERTRSALSAKLVPKEKLRDLSRVFSWIDTNRDGFLDLDEIYDCILREVGENQQASIDKQGLRDQCRARLIQADMDGDSRLSLDEFISSEAQQQSAFPPGFIDACLERLPPRRPGEAPWTPTLSAAPSSAALLLTPPTKITESPAPTLDGSSDIIIPPAYVQEAVSVGQVQVDVASPPRLPSDGSLVAALPTTPATKRPAAAPRPNYKNIANVAVKDDDLRREFDKYDVAKVGYLQFSEFKNAYKAMENFGLPVSDAELDKLFKPFAHSHGRLSFDEFCVLMLRRSRM